MKPVAYRRRFRPITTLALFGCLFSQCTYDATEVLVTMDTDAPASRALTITVAAYTGSGSSDAGSAQSMHTWVRGGPDGGISLPGSFAVTPSSDNNAASETVTLIVNAALATGPAGERALAFRRTARFPFMLHTTTVLPIFLSISCGQLTTGCTAVSGDQCTVSEYCEEQGETCGDQGMCVSQSVMPQPADGGMPDATTDASTDTLVTADVAPPRPIAPLSTSVVTSQQPTLRWVLPSGADGAEVQLCRDRAMSMGCQTVDAPQASSAAPPAALQPGVWFWQLLGRSGRGVGTAAGPVWQFTVGARSAPFDSSYGNRFDPNGDGYEDLLLGASGTQLVHYFAGSASGISATPTANIVGPTGGGGTFGSAVAAADVNGDGLVDIVVGNPGSMGAPVAYVYLSTGTDSTWTGTPLPLTAPANALGGVGSRLASIGDANGDGYADVVATGAFAENAYVFYGNANGISAMPDATLSPSVAACGFYGVSVAGGDINGDGYGDVLVGERGYNINGGRVDIYLGAADGMGSMPSTTVDGPDGPGTFCTQTMGSAGDVDGDGRLDIIVGCEDEAAYAGTVHVYRGTANGLETTPSFSYTAPTPSYLSWSVGPAGDVNGDGFSDILVGAPGTTGPNATAGYALIFLGSAGGPLLPPIEFIGPDGATSAFGVAVTAGDFDGDGMSDSVVTAQAVNNYAGRLYLYAAHSPGAAPMPALTIDGNDGRMDSSPWAPVSTE